MKKWIVGLLSLVLLMVGATGCTPNIVTPPPPGSYSVNLNVDPNITETLRILVPSNDSNKEENLIKALIPGFNKKFPNVTIEFDRRQISDEKYAESINNAIASNKVPDLFYTNTVFYYYLVSKGCIVNIEPYIKASEEAGVFDMEGDFYSEFFDMSMYKDERYIVPRTADSVVCYYNTDILKAAGIDPKTDPRMKNTWTWDDFVSLGKQCSDYFKSAAGQAAGYNNAYALHGDFDWEAEFNSLFESYGVDVFDKDGKVAIDSPQTRELADMIRGLKNEGRFLRSETSFSTFTAGQAAFHFSSLGPADMNDYPSVHDKFDMLPFPLIGENPAVGCGFAGWGISSQIEGDKRDLAWQFLNYMISEEGQMALINAGCTTPSVRVDIAEEKQWGRGYESLNLDAFLANSECKVSSKFFLGHDPSYTFDIMSAIQDFMKSLAYSDRSVENCISICVDDLEDAITR